MNNCPSCGYDLSGIIKKTQGLPAEKDLWIAYYWFGSERIDDIELELIVGHPDKSIFMQLLHERISRDSSLRDRKIEVAMYSDFIAGRIVRGNANV